MLPYTHPPAPRILLSLLAIALCTVGTSPAKVYDWGGNENSQLGDGTVANRAVPASLASDGALAGKTVTKIALGGTHTLALTADGLVFSWGNNGQGQLGDGTTTNRTTPVQVVGLPNDSPIVDISCGANSLAVDGAGRLWSWGDNSVGEVGDGTHVNRSTPVQITTMLEGGAHVALPTITSVSCGGLFNLALTNTGRIYSWGSGGAEGGLLGFGGGEGLTESTRPVPVDSSGVLTGKFVTKISAGVRHSLALTVDGILVAWGRNFEGQLGVGSLPPYETAFSPVIVSGQGSLAGNAVAQFAAGDDFSIVLDASGGLHTWGDNSNSSLGLGDNNNRDHPTAVPTAGNPLATRSITAIAAGLAHAFVLASDNSLISWGSNGRGQLGQGDFTSGKSTPGLAAVPAFMAGRQITSIFATSSSNSSAVITPDVPFVATTLTAEGITSTSATLNGSANSDEDHPSVPAFAYGHTVACELGVLPAYLTELDSVVAAPVSAILSNLQASSTYYFRAMATDSITGVVVSGLPVMFTTQDPPQAPTVTTLPATDPSPFSALLHGTINPHGDTAHYSFSYRIQNPNGSFGSWATTFATDVSGVVDLDVTGLAFFAPAPGSTYQFRLEATNLEGTGTGNLLTFVTPAQPQPTVVTNDADHIASTTSTLHGTINPNLSASFMYFELGSGTNYDMTFQGPNAPFAGNLDQAVSVVANGLTPNTTYHFRLVASTQFGSFFGADKQFTTAGPDMNALVEWRLEQFGVGGILGDPADAADPDGDGNSNLMEFATGTDPKAFNPPPAFQINGNSLVFLYQRNDAAVDLVSYHVEWWDGVNGVPWSSVDVVDTLLSNDGTIQQRQALIPKGPNGMRMVRLRVTTLP